MLSDMKIPLLHGVDYFCEGGGEFLIYWMQSHLCKEKLATHATIVGRALTTGYPVIAQRRKCSADIENFLLRGPIIAVHFITMILAARKPPFLATRDTKMHMR